jgi:hypothetical protein
MRSACCPGCGFGIFSNTPAGSAAPADYTAASTDCASTHYI